MRFTTGTYKVCRRGPGTYQSGEYLSGPEQIIYISGSLQPSNARELKIVEEGTRLKQYFLFYSDDPLLVINTRNLADSDLVVINDESYKVLDVMHWENVPLPHYVSTLSREPQQ